MSDNNNFLPTFNCLKEILSPFVNELILVTDAVDNFYLNTHFIMKNKKPMYFGSVKTNKNYVSFHLMPVYVFPDLLKNISPELKRRMQGKSCFNFSKIDIALFKELNQLTINGFAEYKKAGYL